MCGIAGFLTCRPDPGGVSVLRRMIAAVRHRGPDDEGIFDDGIAFLGHRRLSIIDLSGGHQPMTSEDRTRWIVYNGEIFNHADLRPALEKAGHRYESRCDTETIIHAFEEYGRGCMDRFRGMFAFALWDSVKQSLFCGRDRLGIKPFYYYFDGNLFAFASEIKALLEHPGISAELDESVLAEYLAFGYVSGEQTMFRHIRKLMPAHWLEVKFAPDGLRIETGQYWDVPRRELQSGRDEEYWLSETRRRLEETVRMRLMSDVPLGVFLSGGLDSSVIAALVRRQASGPVRTFSVGYAEAQYSELSYAARVAETIGTEHHEIRVGMNEFFGALGDLIWHEDEPIAWPSSVSLYFVSKLASESVKVVLTGEGSDELFAGYERYRWNLINSRAAAVYGAVVPGIVRNRIRAAVETSNLLGGDLRRKLRHTPLGRESSHEALFLDNFYAALSPEEQRSLLPGGNPADVYRNYRRYWDARAGDSLLGRMLYADQKTYLVELLMKQDQMSMAASIESRVPFLDHTFVEFAAQIPDNLKIRGSVQKYVLKHCVGDLLPRDIIHRTKMGFPTPLRAWLSGPRAADLLARLFARDSFAASYLDLHVLRGMLDRHREGLEDCTDRIWRLLGFQIWGDIFIARNTPVLSDMSLRS